MPLGTWQTPKSRKMLWELGFVFPVGLGTSEWLDSSWTLLPLGGAEGTPAGARWGPALPQVTPGPKLG